MGMLDDPTLVLRPSASTVTPPPPGGRVRFRPSSTFARGFEVPIGAIGVVTGTYERDGIILANVMVSGFGFAAGVRVDEVKAVEA